MFPKQLAVLSSTLIHCIKIKNRNLQLRIEKKLDFGQVVGMRVGYAPIGKPFMSVIFYYLDGLLIDTGAYNTRASLQHFVQTHQVNQVTLTHYHEDHAGNAGFLEKTLSVPVYGHCETVAALRQNVPLNPYEYYLFGRLEKANITPLPRVIETDKYTLHPLHTPGHSKDHVIYHEQNQGWVFSGDLFLGSRIKFFRKDENIVQTIQSLRQTIALDFDKLFCGHNPKTSQPKSYLNAKLEQLVSLMDEVKHLIDAGVSDRQIIKQLCKGKEAYIAVAITLGNVSYRYMITSAIKAIRS